MGIKVKARNVQIYDKHGVTVKSEILTPRLTGIPEEHIVFNCRKDFEQYFMEENGIVPAVAEDWRTAKEGDWVEADDEGMVEIIKTGPLKHPKDTPKRQWCPNGYKRTIVGTFAAKGRYAMDTDFGKHRNRYQFTNSPINGNYQIAVRTRKRLSKMERNFVTSLMMYLHQGNGKTEALVMAIRESGYSASNIQQALEKANTLLQQDRIMTLISSQMKKEAAEEAGITLQWVMEGVKELGDSAKREDVKLSAIKQGGVYLGLEEREEQGQGQLPAGQGYGAPQLGGSATEKTPVLEAETMEASFTELKPDGGKDD